MVELLVNITIKVTGGSSDYDYTYAGCYKATPYLVLSRVFLKDHEIVSREEVDKISIDFSDGFKGVLVNGKGSYITDDEYNSIRRLPVQRSFDNKYFYEVDMKTREITKTPWNGADIFKDINAERTLYYGNSGVAWVGKNGAGVWFIPYAKDATPEKVVEQYVAGSISVDRDNISYIERLSAAVFETKVKNINGTGENIIRIRDDDWEYYQTCILTCFTVALIRNLCPKSYESFLDIFILKLFIIVHLKIFYDGFEYKRSFSVNNYISVDETHIFLLNLLILTGESVYKCVSRSPCPVKVIPTQLSCNI